MPLLNSIIKQATGQSETNLMSQKAITELINPKNGTNYLMVYGTGTPQENAAELNAAIAESEKMPRYLGILDNNLSYTLYKGQVYENSENVGQCLTVLQNIINSEISSLQDESLVIAAGSKAVSTTIIVATAIINGTISALPTGVNIVSLTGLSDVIVNGVLSFGLDRGNNYIKVYGKGTPADNAAELNAAKELSKTMPRYLGNIVDDPTIYTVYPGQTFQFNSSGYVIVSSLMTGNISDIADINNVITELEAKSVKTTIIAAPGVYTFGDNKFTHDVSGVDIVSLTGNADVLIDGIHVTTDYCLIKGINCGTNSFTIADFNNVVCDTCIGGDNSFGGSDGISGTFINCKAGNASFGAYTSGTFINCEGGNYSFGVAGAISGTFTNCKAGNCSFGSGSAGANSGIFINCKAGTDSFGDVGTANSAKSYYCKAGTNSGLTDNAVHLFCIENDVAISNT